MALPSGALPVCTETSNVVSENHSGAEYPFDAWSARDCLTGRVATEELFPADIWMQYQRVFFAEEGWERVLDRWKVDVLVVDAQAHSPLARWVAKSSGWRVVYRDSEGLVAERAF